MIKAQQFFNDICIYSIQDSLNKLNCLAGDGFISRYDCKRIGEVRFVFSDGSSISAIGYGNELKVN